MRLKPILAIAAAITIGALGLFMVWAWAPDLPRDRLEALYLRAAEDIVDVGGAPVHVREDGSKDAPALIFIHGFGSSLHTWEAWVEDLAQDYRVIRFDLPGSGLSPPDPTGRYDDERAIDILEMLMDARGLDDATLIGNSLGGRIAWRFAAARPDRVKALVLISPDGFESQGFYYGEAPDVPPVWSAMRYFLPRAVMRANVASGYGDPSRLTDETLDRYYDLIRGEGAREALLDRTRQTILVDPTPLLPKINAPTLLMWGAKDALIPISNAEDYLRLLPNARLVRFEELGHVPMEEAPAETLPTLRSFLEEKRPDGQD